jgi:hypothetical protein
MQMRFINTYMPEYHLNNMKKFSSYLTENTSCLHYEDHVHEKWESYDTRMHPL